MDINTTRDCGYSQRDGCGECDACRAPRVLECLEGTDGCAGEVLYRWPGYGNRDWPRCQRHGDARVNREQEAISRNGNPDSPCPPSGFDAMAWGERWDDD